MSFSVVRYPLSAAVPMTMGACMSLSVMLFCILVLVLYLKCYCELTMLHRLQSCLRVLLVVQTFLTVAAVVVLSVAPTASGHASATFSNIIASRQAANVLKASGGTLVAGFAFFATEHQMFRWVALFGAATMAGVDMVDMANVGHLIGVLQASRSTHAFVDDSARILAVRALKTQYAAKAFAFFAWLLVIQMIGCIMHALGWFVLNELPTDEEVAGHLKELARATINRRIQEKRDPERFEGVSRRLLFNPTDKLEIMWDQMTDQAIGRENRQSHPISTNPQGRIPPNVQRELCQILLKMGIKRSQVYEVLEDDESNDN
ncbi:hypothetical protein cyc_04309 [Cyclospora cayetanensis]|uniref:Transmembrane protein n=1 Tax=Cyclospora cayetanensis TaxID=88456 RepID=A0A1D3CT92_9EIME|nr:hypothetical protein cyc_04309 [Cyclospora cayetanensis]